MKPTIDQKTRDRVNEDLREKLDDLKAFIDDTNEQLLENGDPMRIEIAMRLDALSRVKEDKHSLQSITFVSSKDGSDVDFLGRVIKSLDQ